MKKYLLLIIVAACITLSSSAQTSKGGKFSIGLEAGIPLGDIGESYPLAIGGSVKFDQPIADKLSFTLSAGYTYFTYPDAFSAAIVKAFGGKDGESFVPLKAGLKYYFGDNFYGEGQLGATIYEGGGAAFAYAPGVGYTFGNHLDLGVRYEGWAKNGTVSQLAARFSYSF